MQHSDSAELQQGMLKGTRKTQVLIVEECQCHVLKGGKVEG